MKEDKQVMPHYGEDAGNIDLVEISDYIYPESTVRNREENRFER